MAIINLRRSLFVAVGILRWVAAQDTVSAGNGDFGFFGAANPNLPVTQEYTFDLPERQAVNGSSGDLPTGNVNENVKQNARSPIRKNGVELPTEYLSFQQLSAQVPVVEEAPVAPVQDIFTPLSVEAPPPQIVARDDHPVPRLGLPADQKIVQTNKFYGNFFLGCQCQPTWTHPYSVWWANGKGNAGSFGMAISHSERDNFTFAAETPARFFSASLNIQHITLSAKELSNGTVLTGESLDTFSTTINLTPKGGAKPIAKFPIVQGMGFVTALYEGAEFLIESEIGFTYLDTSVVEGQSATYEYMVTLNDGFNWMIYVTPLGSTGQPPLKLIDNNTIGGPAGFTGYVQVAKVPLDTPSAAAIYAGAAGAYSVNAVISGNVDTANVGTYAITYTKAGDMAKKQLIFALPHQVASFNQNTKVALTDIKLQTTTKGIASSVAGDALVMREAALPLNVGFAPWNSATIPTFAPEVSAKVAQVALAELSENITQQTNLESMYYSGKGLAKFAMAINAAKGVGGDDQTTLGGVDRLKQALDPFVQNVVRYQNFALAYDSVYGGIVSTGSYGGLPERDFGNTLYNDHHFHYGYFVYAAATIARFDATWIATGTNRAWVEALIRDYANPTNQDPYFPFSRNFDWYHGHSWATGLTELADGKNEESTSEDAFSTYALRLWGYVTANPSLAARAFLQLAITRRSLENYFLLADDNKVQPPEFIANKVTGILFENKVDHTTFFGSNIEYVQGIHMLPLNPSSLYTRSKAFVQQEWTKYFAGDLSKIEGGWRNILIANKAVLDPLGVYNYFAAPGFNAQELNGGASLAWYLAVAATLVVQPVP